MLLNDLNHIGDVDSHQQNFGTFGEFSRLKYDKIRNNAKWDKEIIFFEDLNSQNILKSLPGDRGQNLSGHLKHTKPYASECHLRILFAAIHIIITSF